MRLLVTPVNEQNRPEPDELAFVDQGYTGDVPAQAAKEQGIQLAVVKLPEAKRGFVLLPRR
jgi:hypothetical protein